MWTCLPGVGKRSILGSMGFSPVVIAEVRALEMLLHSMALRMRSYGLSGKFRSCLDKSEIAKSVVEMSDIEKVSLMTSTKNKGTLATNSAWEDLTRLENWPPL